MSENTLTSLGRFYDRKYQAGEEIARSSKLYTLNCLKNYPKLKILDVGCGTGLNSLALAEMGHEVSGIDISAEAIKKYEEHHFSGRVMNIDEAVDFESETFDAIFASEVIEHLTSPERFLSEAWRILRPHGMMLLSTPNSAFWVYRVAAIFGKTVSEIQHPKHFQFFSKRGLTHLLQTAGFSVSWQPCRNMYAIVPEFQSTLQKMVLPLFGFKRELRFRTKKYFWHLSHSARFLNSLFADTLIVIAKKE